jgi:hypothetical protein
MRALLVTAALISAALAQAADTSAADSFICIPDYATGYAIGSNGKWEPTQFNVTKDRYLLRAKDGQWYWTEFGKEPSKSLDLCTGFSENGFLSCKKSENEVLFNRKTLRFQIIHPYGYVVADTSVFKDDPLTPYYMIGKCSPL